MEFEQTDELYHYGRLGMKWGQNIFAKQKAKKVAKKRRKNLEKARAVRAANKQAADEVKKKKEEILKSRSARELYKNAHLFTQEELQKAYSRLELEKKIHDIAPKEVSKGQQFIDKYNKVGKNITSIINTSTALYGSSAKLYKTFSSNSDSNPWQQIKNKEEAARRKEYEKRKEASAAKQAERNASKEAKRTERQQQKAAKAAAKEESKLNEYEIHTGKVYGKGTSTSDLAREGKSWVGSKDYDIEIDFSSPSSSYPNAQKYIESGANYVTALIEDLSER